MANIFRPIWRSLPDQPAYRIEQTWTFTYNPNLISQDRLPVRQQDWPLTPPAPQIERSITFFSVPLMAMPVDTTKIFRGHLRSLPDRGPESDWRRSWVNLGLQSIGVVQGPFVQTDWPNPTQPYRIDQTWAASYNRNLIGKDQLPNRQSDWPLPTQPYRIDQTVAASYNLNLIGKDKLPTGAQTTDLPPRDFARLFQTWINIVNLALVTAPPDLTKQARQQDWPTPRGAESDWRRSWEWSYNKNLIAQDQLPFRQSDWPNPITPTRVFDWIQSTNIALLTAQKPFAQYDWPLTPLQGQPDRSIAASYNLNLIGQDRLPTGAQRSDLWPAGPQQPDRGFGISFNLNLRGQDRLPNRQQDWPLSSAHILPQLQVMVAGTPFFLTLPPLGLPLNATRVFDLAPPGAIPLLQQSVYEYNTAFIPPPPTGPTLILRTLMGTGV